MEYTNLTVYLWSIEGILWYSLRQRYIITQSGICANNGHPFQSKYYVFFSDFLIFFRSLLWDHI